MDKTSTALGRCRNHIVSEEELAACLIPERLLQRASGMHKSRLAKKAAARNLEMEVQEVYLQIIV